MLGLDEAPHHPDVEIKGIVDTCSAARAVSCPAANVRHAHEWKMWGDVQLPAGKMIIPGVIDSTTNFIEHPEAVAERILSFASVLGRENVIAGVDCGFATGAGNGPVDPRSPGPSSRRWPRARGWQASNCGRRWPAIFSSAGCHSGSPAARSASPRDAASAGAQSTPANWRLYRNVGCSSRTRAAAALASSSRPSFASGAASCM